MEKKGEDEEEGEKEEGETGKKETEKKRRDKKEEEKGLRRKSSKQDLNPRLITLLCHCLRLVVARICITNLNFHDLTVAALTQPVMGACVSVCHFGMHYCMHYSLGEEG